MARKQKRTYNVRQAKGAKAPKPSFVTAGQVEQIVQNYLAVNPRFVDLDGPLCDKSAQQPISPNNRKPTPPAYKERLKAIAQGLFELLQKQHAFADYLNPTPQEASATTASPPTSIDELLSIIEYLLMRNSSEFDSLREKF